MGQHVPFDPSELLFINNFYTRFPIGNDPYPNAHPMGLHRSANKDDLHVVYRTRCKEYLSSDSFDKECERKSDKYLDQTSAEFYAEVDRTVEELGMSMEVLGRAVNALSHVSNSALFTQSKNDRVIADMLVACREGILTPIYVALRNKGYNKPELWG